MAGFYIKASEAALRIGVSLVTAKRMINDGRLIGEKIGSRWQVLEESVFSYKKKWTKTMLFSLLLLLKNH